MIVKRGITAISSENIRSRWKTVSQLMSEIFTWIVETFRVTPLFIDHYLSLKIAKVQTLGTKHCYSLAFKYNNSIVSLAGFNAS